MNYKTCYRGYKQSYRFLQKGGMGIAAGLTTEISSLLSGLTARYQNVLTVIKDKHVNNLPSEDNFL